MRNQYTRSVKSQGNRPTRETVARVFLDCRQQMARDWSDSAQRSSFEERICSVRCRTRFWSGGSARECISAEILLGHKKPTDCPVFGTRCLPGMPLGRWFQRRMPVPPSINTDDTCRKLTQCAKQDNKDPVAFSCPAPLIVACRGFSGAGCVARAAGTSARGTFAYRRSAWYQMEFASPPLGCSAVARPMMCSRETGCRASAGGHALHE